MGPTDEELYRRARKGDRSAFAELYERRGPSLYRYALHLSGSPAVAEEVAHDVFLRLIRPDAGFNASRGPLEAYLYGMARNFIRALRRHRDCDDTGEPVAEHNILGELIKNERTTA